MPTTNYVTDDELRSHLGIDGSQHQDSVPLVADAASRLIDEWCGQFFYDTEAASVRYLDTARLGRLRTPPFSTTTGLLVSTDSAWNGTYSTSWASTDFQALPVGGIDPYTGATVAYNELVAIGGYAFPSVVSRGGLVAVTARWGWATVPDPVKHATLLLGARLWKMRDAPLGLATGTVDFGGMRIGRDVMAGVASNVMPYRVRWRVGI